MPGSLHLCDEPPAAAPQDSFLLLFWLDEGASRCISLFTLFRLFPQCCRCLLQVVNKKLKDTQGGYAQFLRENVGEAKVMEEKEKRVKVLEQSTVKAKSKVSCSSLYPKSGFTCKHNVLPIARTSEHNSVQNLHLGRRHKTTCFTKLLEHPVLCAVSSPCNKSFPAWLHGNQCCV